MTIGLLTAQLRSTRSILAKMMDIGDLSIKELEELIMAAKKELERRSARHQRVRLDMERAARQSGLSVEDVAILFGRDST